MEIYADMVKIHYEYFKNKDKYKKHIPSNLKEISKYSDKDSIVFENSNEIVIAMRGLQPGRSFDDVVIGAEIFFEDAYQQSGSDFDTSTKKKKGISLLPNKYGEILLREQSKIDKLKKEYPNKKIVLSGHSRGGRKAIDLGEKNQLEYHAFQPAEMNRMATPLLSMGTSAMVGGIPTSKIEPQFQKNVIGSAVQSDGFLPFAYKFLGIEPEKRKAPTESISNIYKTSNDLVSKGYQHTELVKPKHYAYGLFDHYALGDHSIDHFVSKDMFESVNENRPIEEIEEIEEVKSEGLDFSPPSDITPSSSLGYTVDNVSLCRKYPNYSPHCKKILR